MGPQSRAPDARLLRARHLSENWEETRAIHRYEDELVFLYAKFLQDLKGKDAVKQDQLFAVSRRLSAFHSLVQAGSRLTSFSPTGHEQERVRIGPEQRDRGLIKALVVANAPRSYIAKMLDYEEETIALFEHMAWDVRRRLESRGWLHNHVFAGGLFQETSLADFEGMCVHTAYTSGLSGVERLLGLTTLESEDELKLYQAQFSQEISRRAVVALKSLPLNSHTSPELVNGFIQLHKQDAVNRSKAPGNANKDYQDRVAAVIGSSSFTVAQSHVKYDGPAEEPRCSAEFQRALEQVKAESQLESVK